ncbi:hypothetical protein EZV62_008456 [Acer yangbiense]|uniref:Bulb-type lectin domain-containing protein n=1 Tax=Acer yangbiense TaxID=1000413 RepID=A0A5C7IDD7_9ROSI|nr:hypothetical protein EZV62_008456 [Acer yangbiense]
MADIDNMLSRSVSLLVFLLILSFFGMQFSVVVAVTDSISQGRVVMRSDTIVSAGKVFELGFFTIGNSSNYYVGIWYKQISIRTIVWVANRDLPLTSSSPALTINNEGNLVIVDGRITYEVSDNALSQNTSAILLDSGNFVLRNEHFGVLWQSFDYPSDTLLPGMKLGYSTRNKKLWSIRSWRDVDDPEVGAAELKMDPKFLIDVSGQLKQLLWLEKNQIWGLFWAQPRYECDIYSYCGPFSSCSNYTESFCHCLDGFIPSENWKQKDQSGGCVRRIPLRCEDSSDNSGEDRFLRIDEVKFPLSPKTSKVHAAEECKLACFNSCSCNAYAYNGSGNKQLIWIVAVVVSLAVLLPASYIFCRWRAKRKAKEEIERSQDMLLFDMNMSVGTSTSELSIGDGAVISSLYDNVICLHKSIENGTIFDAIVKFSGYMSPEYALEGLFSIKSDVFSFGVLLLETLSGRKNTGFYNTESLNLLGHVSENFCCIIPLSFLFQVKFS